MYLGVKFSNSAKSEKILPYEWKIQNFAELAHFWEEGGTVDHDPPITDFSIFVFYKSKRQKCAFYNPKRSMVFADDSEIKFTHILIF